MFDPVFDPVLVRRTTAMLAGLALASVVLCRAAPGTTARAQPPRASRPPSVLWIVADDHAPSVAGAYGNTQVRTPSIDRLAAQGLRFDRAYCNSPVCTASRQSLLTGRYPRSLGVTLLETPLPEAEVTLAELLAAAGYRTAALGKMHFNSDLAHGFELRLDLPDHARELASRGSQPLPAGIDVLPPWRPFRDPARDWLNSACRPYGARDADMASTYFARQAAEFLDAVGEAPFFLVVSFTEPHAPFHFPVEDRGRHDPAAFDVPPLRPEDDDQVPAIFRDLTDDQKRGIIAAYYTSVEFLDRNVGRVLDALQASAHADDTLVVYLGDHGYLLGQHGRFEKHTSYEPAIRVPLLVRLPGPPAAGASEALVELVDLAPTVLELCGVEAPDSIQGRSLAPLLTGRTTTHRGHVVVEYAPNDEAMVRDDRWKRVYQRGRRRRADGYDPGRPLTGPRLRLYDLAADPAEAHDLAASAEHADVRQRLIRLLVEHLLDTARLPEHVPATADPLSLLDALVVPRDAPPQHAAP